jgi:hypothetical protein
MTDNLPVPIEADVSFVEPRRQDPIYCALRDLGVCQLHISYSGSCDSGCINEVEAFDKDNKVIPLPQTLVPYTFTHTTYNLEDAHYATTTTETKELPLSEAVEQWCYDLLEEFYPGWEINEGSSGTIIIDPSGREGRIDHCYLVPQDERKSFQ